MDAEEPTYDFDIAVSFAGEDREYVEAFVEGVKNAGFAVFYDDDHIADMWGEDGAEFLTRVYQERARYVVMFVSAAYAEKMWTRLERRAALARAMTERNAYVLPVKLDSTNLPGLLTTTIHVDAKRVGLDGLVQLIAQKLGSSPQSRVTPPVATKVPRSEAAMQALITTRPPAWEYLLYAGILNAGLDQRAQMYRDHSMGYAESTGAYVDENNLLSFGQTALAETSTIIANFEAALSEPAQELAFGKPGEPGDVDQIRHLALRFLSVYEDFIRWAARLRGASVLGEHGREALRLLAQAADQPINEIRRFISDLVVECDTMVERLQRGEKVTVAQRVTLEIEDGLLDRYLEEVKLALKRD